MKNYTTNHANAKTVDYRDVMGIATKETREAQSNEEARMMAEMPAEKRAELEASFAEQDAQALSNEQLLANICEAIMEADDSVCAEFKTAGMLNWFNIDIDGEKITVDMDARVLIINNGADDELAELVMAMLEGAQA